MAVVEAKRAHKNRRRARIRRKIFGTAERPRLSVYRSNVHIYAQLIDDLEGHTLAAADTRQVEEAPEGEVAPPSSATTAGLGLGSALSAKGAPSYRIGSSRSGASPRLSKVAAGLTSALSWSSATVRDGSAWVWGRLTP